MDLSTSLSGSKEFRLVKRGYDPDEVNAFLDQIALGVGELKRKLAEAEDRAVAAAKAAPPAPAPAPEPSAAPAATAEAEEIHRALILAQRAADDEVRRATERAEALVAEAQRTADEKRADLEDEIARRRDEGRADLLVEIGDLERVRDSLANDVVVLERHVDEQREVVQAAIGELQSLLDHPEAFRIAAATGVGTVVPPDARADVAVEPAVDAPPAPEPAAPAAEAPAVEAPAAAPPDPPADPAPAEASTPVVDAPAPPLLDKAASAPPPPPPPPPAADGPATDPTSPVPSPPPAPEALTGPPGGDDDDHGIGPPTEAVAAVADGADAEEDAFLAELRKAMLDDEPLGPRDTAVEPTGFDDDVTGGRGRSRFGRRR